MHALQRTHGQTSTWHRLSGFTLLAWLSFAALALGAPADTTATAEQPNILWITCEDISPNLGCYGDTFAVTPNLDKFATQAVRYTQAFAPIGVCAPSRSCLITGMYPPALGTQHMRCEGTLPSEVQCFPAYLRASGYYCTNNVKTDYNFKAPAGSWDASSNKAHWRDRPANQPFFSVINFTSTHESQIRLPEAQYEKRIKDLAAGEIHDPAKAILPPYLPDAPEVRRDAARYADNITYMDQQFAAVLGQLEADGLAENTIVFFFSDHGAGLPRSKRWLYDSSLRVPLMIRFPKKYAHLAPSAAGTTCADLVSFVDFAPTVLSIAGVHIPAHLQGQPFLGSPDTQPRQYIYGFRDRMDERYDLIRCVSDGRYKYIRNFRPELPYFGHQFIDFMYQMPTMRVWQQMADAGQLTGTPAVFMAANKPTEELYDTSTDPHEVQNLAADPNHAATLGRLRQELRRWQLEIRDLGLLPEADLRTRFGVEPPYTAVRTRPGQFPLEALLAAADVANARQTEQIPALVGLLREGDPAIRWWGALGLAALKEQAAPAKEALLAAATDPAVSVHCKAAEALLHLGERDVAIPILAAALVDKNDWVRLEAINVIDRLDLDDPQLQPLVMAAKQDTNEYVKRVAERAATQFRPR